MEEIALQNLPEGFNAYRELRSVNRAKPLVILLLMCALVPIGPVLGILGWSLLSQHAFFLGALMLFAAGGILYLIFQDIAPQSHLQATGHLHWAQCWDSAWASWDMCWSSPEPGRNV